MDDDTLSIVTDKLLDQAYAQSVANLLKPVEVKPEKKTRVLEERPLSVVEKPLQGLAAMTAGIPLIEQKPQKEFNYRPRMPRAEREAMEAQEYQQKRDNANNDLLMKGLGALAVAGTIGYLGRKQIGRGSELAKQYLDQVETGRTTMGQEYYKTRPSFFDPRFWVNNLPDAGQKADHAVRLKEMYSNPLKVVGAAAYRLGVDNATDASRMYGWRYNHPIAGLNDITRNLIDPMHSLNLPNRSGVGFAALGLGLASSGLAYDVTNPSELFRPKGFKQLNPDPEDPRQSTDPAIEVFQRLAMGRNGRPLKYSEAKKEIPDLDIDRYKDYMNFVYREKGPLGLGAIKYTDENLHGTPELRMMGYPIDIPTITTAVGGALGSRLVTTNMEKAYRKDKMPEVERAMDIQPEGTGYRYNARVYDDATKGMKTVRTHADHISDIPDVSKNPRMIEDYLGARSPARHRRQLLGAVGGVAAGAAAGALLGHFVNSIIANSKNNPEKLPNTQEYGVA
jgi:hypothetical protein